DAHAGRVIVFFFSSRRRHTRSKRDWSSDVCSSDLDTSLVPEALDALAAADSICKFVIGAHAPDLAFAAAEQIVARHRFAQVWVMPEGTSSIQITRGLREIAQAA